MRLLIGIGALVGLQAMLCFAAYRLGVRRACDIIEDMFWDAGMHDVLETLIALERRRTWRGGKE